MSLPPEQPASVGRALAPFLIGYLVLVLGSRHVFHAASRHSEDLGGGITPLGLLFFACVAVLVAAADGSTQLNLLLWGVVGLAFLIFLGAVHGGHGPATATGNGFFVGALLLVVFALWSGIRGR